ncbi:MAG: O-antigen ligase family protein [Rhizobacter sp.]|nr:O-antigen ligase family protein [Rhizobacter sp.]
MLALLVWQRSPPLRVWWRQHRWLLAFWALYGARLLWDGLIGGQPGVPEALVFYVLTVLLPCTALGLNAVRFDERRTVRLLVLLGGVVCIGAIVMNTFGLGQERSLGDITDRLYFEALNPISLGHAAATTLIAAMCATQHRQDKASLLFTLTVAAAAGVCIALSGSRGPTLALGVGALLFVAATGRWGWLALALLVFLPQALNSDAELWQRFLTVTEDNSALERLLLQENAIQQFLSHPLLGSAYVELEFKEYPHNVIIECAMALGVVGLGILAATLWRAAKNAIALTRGGRLLLPLLFTQYFVAAQFSGALWGSSALWACAALLVGLAHSAAPQAASRRTPRRHISPAAPQAGTNR